MSNRYCSYSYATVDGVTLTAGMWNGAFAAMLDGFDAVQADVDGDKANQVRYSGLTANYNAAGYRITGAGNGVNPQDYVTMAQLTATAFSPALPTQSGNAGRAVRTTGASAYWATDSASAQTMAYNGNGQLTGITETVDGYSKSTSYTYNSDGTLNTEAITMHGVTRTRTYSYSNGQLTGSTEV